MAVIGKITFSKELPIYTINDSATLTLSNSKLKSDASPQSVYGRYTKTSTVSFQNGNVTVTQFYKIKQNSKIVYIPDITSAITYTPASETTTTSNRSASKSVERNSISELNYEPNVYVRPTLQIKKGDKLISFALRISNFQSMYANMFSPTMTNGGWYIHSAGAQLPTFSLNGFFLDSQKNQEFSDFMNRYQTYIKAYRDGDFLSSAICTFFFKGKEYKCLIASFSQSQAEVDVLLSRFNMQLLVLKEIGFLAEDAISAIPKSTESVLNEEGGYSSSLQAMLLNTITSY